MINYLRNIKRKLAMAKNSPKKGRSTRNGNQPSPYQKHGKKPYRYSAAYYEWRRGVVTGAKRGNKYSETSQREYQ